MERNASSGAPIPRATNRRWYRIVFPTFHQPLHLTLLSERFFGVWTHWDKDAHDGRGANQPCQGGPQSCHYCRAPHVGIRYVGYVSAWSYGGKWVGNVVAHLSEGACAQLAAIHGRRRTLRGLTVKLKRGGAKINDPVEVETLDQPPGFRLAPDFDPIPHVLKMFCQPSINQPQGYMYPRPWMGEGNPGEWTARAGWMEDIPT